MAYAYVKSGGTATGTAGKYTTAKTGSWSTAFTNVNQYYGDLYSCYSSASLVDNDIVYVSDEHNYNGSISSDISIFSYTVVVRVISVDNDDLSVKSIGAKETYTNLGTSQVNFNFSASFVYGLIFELTNLSGSLAVNNDVFPENYNFYNCTFKTTIQSNIAVSKFRIAGKSNFYNCTFDIGLATNYTFNILDHSYIFVFKDCVFIAPTSQTDCLWTCVGGYYGAALFFDGCDFSQANRPLLLGATSWNSDSNTRRIVYSRCLEGSNSRNNTPYGSIFVPFEFRYCSRSPYFITQYYYSAILDCSVSVYRIDGAEYSNSLRFSEKIVVNAFASLAQPFTCKLSEFYYDTSSPTTFTVEIAQDNGAALLTESDISIEVYHIDDTTSKAHRKSTCSILPSSTSLPTSSKTWVGLTNPTKQYLSITTTETGSYGLCSVHINVSVPNLTFYVCPKVDIS